MELFVVMVADRHTDDTAYVFSTEAAAGPEGVSEWREEWAA